MKTLKEQDYTINICTDIIEWAKEFYGMPDDAILANEEEVGSECMGFAQIEEKSIWVFVPKNFSPNDLGETIAHEIGHVIEMKFPINPEQIEENEEIHEMKADHYMNFYLLVDKIINNVLDLLKNQFSQNNLSDIFCQTCHIQLDQDNIYMKCSDCYFKELAQTN